MRQYGGPTRCWDKPSRYAFKEGFRKRDMLCLGTPKCVITEAAMDVRISRMRYAMGRVSAYGPTGHNGKVNGRYFSDWGQIGKNGNAAGSYSSMLWLYEIKWKSIAKLRPPNALVRRPQQTLGQTQQVRIWKGLGIGAKRQHCIPSSNLTVRTSRFRAAKVKNNM